ncbi:uncharacterized protein LOC112467556 [Temnothorax curvispinosus]|uniref:Uncharacterized protein LOC112467556 n=1 Tax=Temnothorax curvispinosus TaxID=300111 RepID=A0A6J1RBA7_9HYME|nr:uncharacterized protein LOC112467556 [Temnothorax curvispinosus]
MATSKEQTEGDRTHQVKEELQTNRVGLRMPPFWPEEPELWFAQLESQFIICGITQDTTRYAYALSQIDTRYAKEIKDIVTSPPAEHRYKTLKKTLIQRLSTSQEQRTRQLLEREELGDRKPSQFLRHLKGLAGTAVPDSLLRTLWLGRLPAQMQVVLATRQGDRLEDVAEQADRIHEVNNRAVVAAVEATSTEKTTLQAQIEALTKQVAALTTQFSQERKRWRADRSRSRSRNRSRNRGHTKGFTAEHCYYHRTFKDKARNCEEPCTYKAIKPAKPENTEGSC